MSIERKIEEIGVDLHPLSHDRQSPKRMLLLIINRSTSLKH